MYLADRSTVSPVVTRQQTTPTLGVKTLYIKNKQNAKAIMILEMNNVGGDKRSKMFCFVGFTAGRVFEPRDVWRIDGEEEAGARLPASEGRGRGTGEGQ